MHIAKPLEVVGFDDPANPLNSLETTNQLAYISAYLRNLGVTFVLVEQNYFDRDFLSEFSSFYSLSAQGYPNICKRIHFFSSAHLDRDVVARAISEEEDVLDNLQDTYLGFVVIRPLASSPFGRTVLRWFDDTNKENPRIIEPSRTYECHIGGITLRVNGIAWQQQDSGVAACATVGIWTMLHSSAFDAAHAIPTTADITKAAHKSASLGSRMFPSNSLTAEQLMEAVKEHGFAPVACSGDLPEGYFSLERLGATCAAFLRSGYPVLILGKHNRPGIGHALCAVGFREPSQPNVKPRECGLFDGALEILYTHDDNIGPNVRFRIVSHADYNGVTGAALVHEPPEYVDEKNAPNLDYPEFFPTTLIVAVHEELRISPDNLHVDGHSLTFQIGHAINQAYVDSKLEPVGFLFSTRFIRLPDYFSEELRTILGDKPAILAQTRLALLEKVPPMSLHVGVVRIAIPNSSVLLDILFDTTDTDRNRSVFAHIVYDNSIETVLSAIDEPIRLKVLGVPVKAY